MWDTGGRSCASRELCGRWRSADCVHLEHRKCVEALSAGCGMPSVVAVVRRARGGVGSWIDMCPAGCHSPVRHASTACRARRYDG